MCKHLNAFSPRGLHPAPSQRDLPSRPRWGLCQWCTERMRDQNLPIEETIFTALHAMQMRSSDENSVCLFVRLSVKCVLCDKTVGRSVQIYMPYERTFSLVFWEEEWLVGGNTCLKTVGDKVVHCPNYPCKMIGGKRPLVPEILSQSDRVGVKFEQAAITPKRYEIGCQLLLITNRK